MLSGPSSSVAQTALSLPWVVDPQGTVTAIARDGNTLFLGGHFSRLYPTTGGGVILNPETGAIASSTQAVAGRVNACVDDGLGGWFIGGEFTSIGSFKRQNLAHIRGDGTVAPWKPAIDGEVFCLARDGRQLFVGGAFNAIGGASRRNVAVIDAMTGSAMPWAPTADAAVLALAVGKSTVYLGGQFQHIGTLPRPWLGAVSKWSGETLPWSPAPDGRVLTITIADDTVYFGGSFRTVGGLPREFVASATSRAGSITSWAVDLSQTPPITGFPPEVKQLLVDGGRVYVAGIFDHVGSAERQGLVAVDRRSGDLLDWNPQLRASPIPGFCDVIALRERTLYLGGSFSSVGGVDAPGLAAAVDTYTGTRSAWAFSPNHLVSAICSSGQQLFAGGVFTGAGEPIGRAGLAAIDLRSGHPLPWNPSIDGQPLNMQVRDGLVYIGGRFQAIGGQPRANLAAVDAISGVPTEWDPSCDGQVWTLAITDSVVYAGGLFGAVGGQPRSNLAALNRVDGRATPWNPAPNDFVKSVVTADGAVFAAGEFLVVGGQRRTCVAKLDATTGLATPWKSRASLLAQCMAVEDTTLVIGGEYFPAGFLDPLVEVLAIVDTRTGDSLRMITGLDDQIVAVGAQGGVAYAGGRFTRIGGESRSQAAAVAISSGRVLAWDPRLDQGVLTLSVDPAGAYLGGRLRRAAGVPCGEFAVLTPALEDADAGGAAPTILNLTTTNPSSSFCTVRFTLSARCPVTLAMYDVQGRQIQSLVSGELLDAGPHTATFDTTRWPLGCYICRLDAGSADASGKVVVLR